MGRTARVRPHQRRLASIADLLAAQGGVLSRRQLRGRGIDRHAVRAEVAAGRWSTWGTQTVVVEITDMQLALQCSALFEVGTGARLDGASSLERSGLTGWRSKVVEVSVPHTKHHVRLTGAVVRSVSNLEPPTGNPPRSPVIPAALREANWLDSDWSAVTLLAMVVQQRLARGQDLLDAWHVMPRSPRREVVEIALVDVCGGSQAMRELDFAGLCRLYHLPPPERQAVLTTPAGRIYRDAHWPGLTVEDARRANAVALTDDRVLRVPNLGLLLREAEFMGQVVAAYHRAAAA